MYLFERKLCIIWDFWEDVGLVGEVVVIVGDGG